MYDTDINTKILAAISDNHAHFHETGLALIARHNAKHFHASDKFPQDKQFHAFIITVGTPFNRSSAATTLKLSAWRRTSSRS